MKIKATITLIGLLIISGSCDRTYNNQPSDAVVKNLPVVQVEHADIRKMREELPEIKTPITFNSAKDLNLKSISASDNKILTRLENKNGFFTFGKIFEKENFVTIIGYVRNDTGTPILLTFDKAGHELSSHVIYETVMGDMGRYTSNAVTIWTDRSITFTDSTVTRQINTEGDDEIPGTDSLIVTKRNYEITDAGMIKKID